MYNYLFIFTHTTILMMCLVQFTSVTAARTLRGNRQQVVCTGTLNTPQVNQTTAMREGDRNNF